MQGNFSERSSTKTKTTYGVPISYGLKDQSVNGLDLEDSIARPINHQMKGKAADIGTHEKIDEEVTLMGYIASPTEEVSNQAPVPQSIVTGREKHRHGKQGTRISGPSTLKRWKREARTRYTNVATTSVVERKLRKRKGEGGETETGQQGEEKKR
ncbi:hypothetical protein FH972_010898 [Carpinus fangiana]|uniref:Uncharacterized protein n=1 Tax=Carpinus fangiana TaxID=176857 RepID=A0A660KVQ6_9ROSI|nr:hypothetical protein FH972_010898 [Carpinus fangiana]